MQNNEELPQCGCGCGQQVRTAPDGSPRRFLHGHNAKKPDGAYRWKHNGYWMIRVGGKPVPEHRHVMEQFLGRSLQSSEIVHHIDEDPFNNAIGNLVVMTRSAHMIWHMRNGRPTFWTEEDRAKGVAMYLEGATVQEVALTLGKSVRQTHRVLSRAGVARTAAETRYLRLRRAASLGQETA